jgi:hypothetical protein
MEGPYKVEDEPSIWEVGRSLIGPDGFSCYLGEPEDRTWFRDGRDAVDELNRLASRVEQLKQAFANARDTILNERHQLAEEDFGSDRINAVLGVLDDEFQGLID